MGPLLVIVENDPDRVERMGICIERDLPDCRRIVLDNAPDACEWIRKHLTEASLISLDNDLGEMRTRDGQPFNPGTGITVARLLCQSSVHCPAIVHTDNHLARRIMLRELAEAGWEVSFAAPGNGLAWIDEAWIGQVKQRLGR